jgi:hypothetical protein
MARESLLDDSVFVDLCSVGEVEKDFPLVTRKTLEQLNSKSVISGDDLACKTRKTVKSTLEAVAVPVLSCKTAMILHSVLISTLFLERNSKPKRIVFRR